MPTSDQPDRVSELIKALYGPDREVRRIAAEGLGWIGAADERVVTALIKALAHEDGEVRKIAQRALDKHKV